MDQAPGEPLAYHASEGKGIYLLIQDLIAESAAGIEKKCWDISKTAIKKSKKSK